MRAKDKGHYLTSIQLICQNSMHKESNNLNVVDTNIKKYFIGLKNHKLLQIFYDTTNTCVCEEFLHCAYAVYKFRGIRRYPSSTNLHPQRNNKK